MNRVRIIYAGTVAIALGIGYLASQLSVLRGTQLEYATAVDIPQVNMACLALLGIGVILHLIPTKDGAHVQTPGDDQRE